MRRKDPYCVFPKKLASGKIIYYYTVYVDGKRKQYSTGQLDEISAHRHCIDLFKSGKLIPSKVKSFEEYVVDWYVYDKCRYIQGRLNRGFSQSRSSTERQRRVLVNHILPFFRSMQIKLIVTRDIEDWVMSLKSKGLSNTTINHYMSTLRLIFKEAFRLGDIELNPMSTVLPFKNDQRKKGVLTDDEVKALFSEDNFRIWKDEKHRALNLLASMTGLRMGEIQALRLCDIQPEQITVSHSWDRKYGLKGTKTGEVRTVPIPLLLYNTIKRVADPTSEYVYSISNVVPMNNTTIKYGFYKALDGIGIDDKKRKARNITFHSWRHYFNTKLRVSGIPDVIVQSVIGHKSMQMTTNYTNAKNIPLETIKTIQKQIVI